MASTSHIQRCGRLRSADLNAERDPDAGISCLKAPWRYARLLDYAVDRLLLQLVGAGYQFMHPLLLDYFAHRQDRAVYPPPAQRLATVGRRIVRSFRLAGEDAARFVRRGEPGSGLGWRA